MTVPVFNIEAVAGGTITVAVTVTESDGTASDLSGYTGEMQVRESTLSETVLATGTVVISGNTVTGTIPASQTEDADWVAAVYDIRIVNGTTVEYVVRGQIKLLLPVTHS